MSRTSVARLLAHHEWEGPPDALMVKLCTDLLREARAAVPVDVRALASWRGAVVEEAEQPIAGWLYHRDGRLVIRVRASDVEGRRRFTICHEICHTFFPDFRESDKARVDQDVERFDHRNAEEYLCDLGAAELLLPRETFRWMLPDRFDLDDTVRFAAHYRASIEATARRCATLATSPVAFVVLERAGKERALRVRWAISTGLAPIRPGTPVPKNCRLTRALGERDVRYRGETALLVGSFEVSARLMPYERVGETVDRVLALLRPC